MRRIAVSQRVEITAHNERRDALDQRWISFLSHLGYLPILIPNSPALVKKFLDETECSGIILTGGNDLAHLGGDAPERDATESVLLHEARSRCLPLLGICRGLQFILHQSGVELQKVVGHAGTQHSICGEYARECVNSYHHWTANILSLPETLVCLATASDSSVEAVKEKDHPILGLMWHPERVHPYATEDVKLIKNFFGGVT